MYILRIMSPIRRLAELEGRDKDESCVNYSRLWDESVPSTMNCTGSQLNGADAILAV